MKANILFLFFLIQSPALFAQNTIYVNQNIQGGAQNGTSWADAFTDLQQALAIAQYGDEIWVAEGIYYPTETTNRSISFELKNGVRVLGGFNGTEIIAEQRDPLLNPTRLSANIGNSAFWSDNSYHVLRGRGLDANTVLDGFIISDGYSIGGGNLDSDSKGAGLYLVGSSALTNSHPLISNCRFEYNEAGAVGGALYASFVDRDDPFLSENLVNPVLRNCTFDQNAADVFGGAICKEGPTGDNDSFLVEDCRFTWNFTYTYDGGGIFFARSNESKIVLKRCLFDSNTSHAGQGGGFCIPTYEPGGYTTDLVLDSCVFRKNVAPVGGGFYYDGQSSDQPNVLLNLSIRKCLFEENTSKNDLGSAFVVTTSNNEVVNAELLGCKFYKNKARGYFTTAFLAYEQSESNVLIENCEFLGNVDINNPSFYCAAFDAGGYKVNTRINNCLFANNGSALFAGGDEQSQINTQVTNCTFYLNGDQPFGKRWYPSYNQAGAVYYNKMNFQNCVIWETKATNRLIYNNYPSLLTGSWFFFDYCSFHPMEPSELPNALEVFGDSIFIGAYPDFLDTAANDFHLKTCSPVMNRGNNQATLDAGLFTDLDGQPRIRYTTVDLGAYETQDSCFTIQSKEPQTAFVNATLSPNPVCAGERLELQLPNLETKAVEWVLHHPDGRQLGSGRSSLAEPQRFFLQAPSLPGLYFVELSCGNQRSSLKFIVHP